MLKDTVNVRPTSREMYLVGINTCFGPNPRASLQDLHSGLGRTLVLIPDLLLPSQLVSSIYYFDILDLVQTGSRDYFLVSPHGDHVFSFILNLKFM